MREDTTVHFARTITVAAPECVRIKAYKPNENDDEWHIRFEASAPYLEDAQVYVDRVLGAIADSMGWLL